jgi:hypothetical protein
MLIFRWFGLNLSISLRYCVLCGVLNKFQALVSSLARNLGKTQNPRFLLSVVN